MKTKDVSVGLRCKTKVGASLVAVEVVGIKESCDGRTKFRVRRLDNGSELPKARTAAALR